MKRAWVNSGGTRAFLPGLLLLVWISLGRAVQAGSVTGRDACLKAMAVVMGPLPSGERGALNIRLVSEVHQDGLVLRDLTYESLPGVPVPAYLLFPAWALTRGERLPAVLGLHQTHAAGRKVVVGLGNSPDDAYGVELAKRGFVVLAPGYPELADHAADIRGQGFESGSLKAVWDNMRGLDLLATLPFVRTNGFGAIGHSLGGHNGLFTAAFDERIRVVVTSCGFDSFRDYYGGDPAVWAEGRGWCQVRYMPRLLAYRGRLESVPFDFTEVLGAIAPRRVWVSAPTGDGNFRWQSVDRVLGEAKAAWPAGSRAPEVVHPGCGHRFRPEERLEAYRVIESELNGPGAGGR